eukprot:m.32425 g.32425  ORF g.32425 m.32425 type:complete len:94 (+) comp6383_c0_seq1:551-832(+)
MVRPVARPTLKTMSPSFGGSVAKSSQAKLQVTSFFGVKRYNSHICAMIQTICISKRRARGTLQNMISSDCNQAIVIFFAQRHRLSRPSAGSLR